jgi:tetratricopeptide (TPR) repeat protein
MKKTLLVFVVLLSFSALKAMDEQSIVRQHLQLANGYLSSDNEKSAEFANKALLLSEKIQYIDGQAEAYWLKGRLNFNAGKIKESGLDFLKASELFKKSSNTQMFATALKDYADFLRSSGNLNQAEKIIEQACAISIKIKNQRLQSECELSQGLIALSRNDFAKATGHYLNAMKISEEVNDNAGLGNAYLQLGNINTLQGNIEQSNEYFLKGLNLNKKSGNKLGESDAACNIGSNYLKIGSIQRAEEYIAYSLKLSEELKYNSTLALNLMNMGFLKVQQKQYTEAEKNFKASHELYKKMNDNIGSIDVLNALGYLYSVTKKYSQAEDYYKQANVLAGKIGSSCSLQTAYEGLAYIYEQKKDYQKAYQFTKLGRQINEKLFNADNAKKVTQLQMNYEFSKIQEAQRIEQELKDEITSEKSKRLRIAIGFGVFAVLSLIALLASTTVAYRKNKIARALLAERNGILQIQKENSEKIIQGVLPAEIEKRLKTNSSASQERFVSAMFVDFVNFAKKESEFEPMDLMDHLDVIFKMLEETTRKYQLDAMKTMVDGYLCISGLSNNNESESLDRLINAGLEILQQLHVIQQKRAIEGLPSFEMKIGIHSGSIIGGVVAVRTVSEDVWGNTVQIASEIEKFAKPSQLLLTETANNLSHSFKTHMVKEVTVMNDKAMKVYGIRASVELSQLKVSKDNIDEDVMKHLS